MSCCNHSMTADSRPEHREMLGRSVCDPEKTTGLSQSRIPFIFITAEYFLFPAARDISTSPLIPSRSTLPTHECLTFFPSEAAEAVSSGRQSTELPSAPLSHSSIRSAGLDEASASCLTHPLLGSGANGHITPGLEHTLVTHSWCRGSKLSAPYGSRWF